MYHIAVHFEVPADRREEFIAVAREDAEKSIANEPGSLRFEVIEDADNPNKIYLNEAYADEAAFDVHLNGPYAAKFFELIQGWAVGPTWLIKGTRIS
ncbi:putative quinol monooxygenase [Nocardia sp. JMUB6875]|uniref:putative quinol monooxygenase n=1 Tax=Nocardia sp. JMUB6875 TaxID=3158170 RepID=UPI0032E68F46